MDIYKLIIQIATRTLVGYSPRLHAIDTTTGKARYLRWQHTWWNGMYSIVLSKVCFLHKDYLADFFKVHCTSYFEVNIIARYIYTYIPTIAYTNMILSN